MPHLQDWIAIKFLVQKYGAGIVLPGVDFDGKGGLEVRQESQCLKVDIMQAILF